jgi:hypothetical protein
MAGDRDLGTQEGKPSGKDPMRSRGRLAWEWLLVPLVIAAGLLIVFGLKALL